MAIAAPLTGAFPGDVELIVPEMTPVGACALAGLNVASARSAAAKPADTLTTFACLYEPIGSLKNVLSPMQHGTGAMGEEFQASPVPLSDRHDERWRKGVSAEGREGRKTAGNGCSGFGCHGAG